MNQVEFSQIVGVSKAAISKAVKIGRLDVDSDGEININGVNTKNYLRNKNIDIDSDVDDKVTSISSKNGRIDTMDDAELTRLLKISKLKTEQSRRNKIDYELQITKGEYIKRDFVRSHLFGYLDALSDKLLDAPDTLIDILHTNWLALGDDARSINMDEINEYVTESIQTAKTEIREALNAHRNKNH
ncbi:hypothetical protein IHC93_19860 [Photobacterium damselae subsp. damselae]|uniref:hypothetical protein n=1 Tax=Photobacterium damselae TaxID=38293 RepID=UPI001F251E15|nr:hypothetical protein [Photobacterium damselae]UKA27181.1 hypothetical protein IHC93_19860 [Photobacterium damselae subsp. damselae]